MRLATWNINGLRARKDYFLRWVGERRPDVIALQELKVADESFPHEIIEAAGYTAATHGQKAWNGVAIVSRTSVEVTQTGLPGQEEFGARLLTATVEDLSFTTVYCPNGKSLQHDDFPRKLTWFDDLIRHLRNRHAPDDPVMVCGDFNICPAAIDSWDEARLGGQIFHTDEERARLAALFDWGLHDLFRDVHPDVQAFSWWDYRGGAFHRKMGLRIDLILATDAVARRVRHVEIDRDYRKKIEGLTPSDHAPVIVDLD